MQSDLLGSQNLSAICFQFFARYLMQCVRNYLSALSYLYGLQTRYLSIMHSENAFGVKVTSNKLRNLKDTIEHRSR
ncbi:hypothetical protein Plhal304r1_c026g0087331 [Plasmopara halstedii]